MEHPPSGILYASESPDIVPKIAAGYLLRGPKARGGIIYPDMGEVATTLPAAGERERERAVHI